MKLRILPKAQRDLLEVQAWLERERPQHGAQQLDIVIAGLAQLERFPKSGPVCRDERLAIVGFRTLVVGEFIVFYKLQRRAVFVYRVLHHRVSWDALR